MMKLEFEQQVFDVFNRILAVPPEERAALLTRDCGQDDLLRQEVGVLLQAAETRPGEAAADQASATVWERDWRQDVLEQGTRIGSFQITRLLGEGGMARVYLAHQSSPRRQVALKVIRRGVDPEQSRRRFELEKQMLAHLNHPHIAKIFEAGVTEAGAPFFAMEYIEGQSLCDYCDQHRLDVAERLGLMISVCEAVQHAHQKGVIHRDLKPANVLVTLQNGRPVPKIIDFGIAKVIGETHHLCLSASNPSLTGTAFIGSLAYMSPEQARVTDAHVDTRTDVYALGIVLYQLLVGESPFGDLERLTSLEEIFRHIREREPRKPSDHFKHPAEAARAAVDPRRGDARGLHRCYRNDLDWITLKALEKDPDRRYGSPADLARDIAAFMENRPVSAGPPSVTYRLAKLVRRNRLAVVFSCVVLCLLVAGLAGTRHNLILARAEAARQQKTLTLLQELITSPDPLEQGPDTRVRDLLDGFSAKLQSRLGDEPEILATLHYTLGKTYTSLDLLAQAHKHAVQARDLRRQYLGAYHPATLEANNLLGSVLGDLGQFDDAEILLRDTAAATRRVLGVRHESTLQVQLNLATVLMNKGRSQEAETLLCETFLSSSEVLGPHHAVTADCLDLLGIILMKASNPEEAESMQRLALAARYVINPEPNITILKTMCFLANSLMDQQKFAEAEDLLREALAAGIELLGIEHRGSIYCMNSLSRVLSKQGKHDEALGYSREAVALSEEQFGLDHPTTLIIKSNLVLTYKAQARWREAEVLLRQIIPDTDRVLGVAHPQSIGNKQELADILKRLGKIQEAASFGGEIFHVPQQALGADHKATVAAEKVLARVTAE